MNSGDCDMKLDGWKEKQMSIVGREILMKAVARALSTYDVHLQNPDIHLLSFRELHHLSGRTMSRNLDCIGEDGIYLSIGRKWGLSVRNSITYNRGRKV